MSNFVTMARVGNYGRLGNQLFQVAATLSYAERTGKRAIFKDWYCDREHIRFADYFEHSLNYRPLPHNMGNYSEPGYTYSRIPDLPGDVNLFGYFQSVKYFTDHSDIIRHYFTPRIENESFLRGYWDLQLAETTASIHVRRTDYLVSPHIYPSCTKDYYTAAIDQMKREHGVTHFMVFGDDIGWCKQTFQGDEFTFVEGQKSIEDLFLMSFCQHNIIANSSFSWWGSWLNRNPEKCVIAPRKWILNQNAKDVYCSNWQVM